MVGLMKTSALLHIVQIRKTKKNYCIHVGFLLTTIKGQQWIVANMFSAFYPSPTYPCIHISLEFMVKEYHMHSQVTVFECTLHYSLERAAIGNVLCFFSP